MLKGNERGQIFSTDLVMASIVFLFILTISMIYSMQVANRVLFVEEDRARYASALSAADALMLSPGQPGNWENLGSLTGVSSLGIVKADNEIHPGKLQHLVDLNAGSYDEVRQLLGVSGYGLKVTVLRLQDRQSLAEFGLDPGEEQEVSVVDRIALYNGEEVLVKVKVFET